VTRWFGPPAPGATFVDYIAPIDAGFAQSFRVGYQALTAMPFI
jgi:hypothetical protein